MTDDSLFSREHEAKLHGVYQPPGCIECYPNGAPEQPTPDPPPAAPPRQPNSGFQSLGGAISKRFARRRHSLNAVDLPPDLPADGGPPCTACSGWRKVRRDVPIDHADFGRSFDCQAAECLAWTIQQRLDRLYESLPEKYRDWTLDTFPCLSPLAMAMVASARAWVVNPERPWLYLYGPAGRGKTGLAVGILQAAIRAGRTGSFRSTIRLLRRIRQSYGDRASATADESRLLAVLYDVDLLVIDGLSEARDTDWAVETLFDVINERYVRERQTIITSNDGPLALAERLGEIAVSRIQDMAGTRYTINFASMPNLRVGPERPAPALLA